MIDLTYCDGNVKMLVDIFKNYLKKIDYNTDIFKDSTKFAIDSFGILLTEYHMGAVTQNDHFNLMADVYLEMQHTEEYQKWIAKRNTLNNWVKLSKGE